MENKDEIIREIVESKMNKAFNQKIIYNQWINHFTQFMIGREKEEVRGLLNELGKEFRIVREDDKNYVITCDLHPDRFNLEFDNGVLTNISFG